MDIGTYIDELAQISKNDGKNKKAGDRTYKQFKPDSFDHRTAFYKDFDNKYYRVHISVGVDKNGKTVYSIGKDIKEQGFPKQTAHAQKRRPIGATLNDKIPQSERVVKYSTEKNSEEKSVIQIALEKAGITDSIFGDTENDTGKNSIDNLSPEQQDAADGYAETNVKKSAEQFLGESGVKNLQHSMQTFLRMRMHGTFLILTPDTMKPGLSVLNTEKYRENTRAIYPRM